MVVSQVSIPSAGRIALKPEWVWEQPEKPVRFNTLSGSNRVEAQLGHSTYSRREVSIPSAGRIALKLGIDARHIGPIHQFQYPQRVESR